MKHVYTCRRTFLALVSIICLMIVAFFTKADVVWGIVAIVSAVAGANAYQGVYTKGNVMQQNPQQNNTQPDNNS